MPTCPNCGQTLVAVAVPLAPPYACWECVRGWWKAELTLEARSLWEHTTRSHGASDDGEKVRAAAEAEQDAQGDQQGGQEGAQ